MGRVVPFESPRQRRARPVEYRTPRLFPSRRTRTLFIRCAFFAVLLATLPYFLDRENSAPPPQVSVPAAHRETYPHDFTPRDRISVYDGDTIRLGDERIRIVGLDTPELGHRAECESEALAAEQARQALIGEIARGNVALHRQGTDRYGRTLARVTVDGRDVAATLIANGHARPYAGGRRESWCG